MLDTVIIFTRKYPYQTPNHEKTNYLPGLYPMPDLV
jgi:hypothetical protein